MFTVNVDRQELLEILEKNLTTHRDTFLKAQEKYRAAVIEEFERRLQLARDNKEIDTFFKFAVPSDHTDDYNRIIGMLNMHTDRNIELGEEEYNCYVNDEWHWKRQWSLSNSAYGI